MKEKDTDHDNPVKITKDTHDNHSGRLVEYSGSDSDSDDGVRELSPRTPSTPVLPSPSPEQRRRNQQGEAILNNFGSRSILYLLGESLRREEGSGNQPYNASCVMLEPFG